MKLSYGIPLLDSLDEKEFERYVKMLNDIGYDGVECSICEAKKINTEAFKKILKKYGMKLSGLRSGAIYDVLGYSFSDNDPKIREKAITYMEAVVDLCAEFECPILVGRIQGLLKDGITVDTAKSRIKECLRVLAEYAGKTNTIVSFEPINRFEMDYNHTTKEVIEFLKEVNDGLSHKVTLLMDIYHMALEDNSIAASFVRSKDMISHVHFRDINCGVPGSGNLDFLDAVKILEAMDYNGWIALEVAFDFCDYEKGAVDSYRFLKPMFETLE